jgi:hypothetical protein
VARWTLRRTMLTAALGAWLVAGVALLAEVHLEVVLGLLVASAGGIGAFGASRRPEGKP